MPSYLVSSPPWRDFLGQYCKFYIIYKSKQYSLTIACQVWARVSSFKFLSYKGVKNMNSPVLVVLRFFSN